MVLDRALSCLAAGSWRAVIDSKPRLERVVVVGEKGEERLA